MERLLEIATLAGSFKDAVELQTYCDAQYAALQKATAEITSLRTEIEHLKTLLTSITPLVTDSVVAPIEVSSEQAICEIQINKLLEWATQRELTLEEVKRLDLLVKNLYLAKGKSTAIVADYAKLPQGVSEENLLEIASDPV